MDPQIFWRHGIVIAFLARQEILVLAVVEQCLLGDAQRVGISLPLVKIGQRAQRFQSAALVLGVKMVVLNSLVDQVMLQGRGGEDLDGREIRLPLLCRQTLGPYGTPGVAGALVVPPGAAAVLGPVMSLRDQGVDRRSLAGETARRQAQVLRAALPAGVILDERQSQLIGVPVIEVIRRSLAGG